MPMTSRSSTTPRSSDLIATVEPGRTLTEPRRKPRGLLETTLNQALNERVLRPFTINTEVAREWYEIRVQMPDGVLSVMSPERRRSAERWSRRRHWGSPL